MNENTCALEKEMRRTLLEKLEQNYLDYTASLQALTSEQMLDRTKEVYAAQVCCRLVQRRDDISLPQMRHLLSLDDPLAALRDTWLELHSGDNEPVLKVILYKLCGEMWRCGMEKVCVTVSMEEERLKALEFALKKKNSSVQRRMDDALRQLYEKEVPEPIREYVDSLLAPPPPSPPTGAGGEGDK